MTYGYSGTQNNGKITSATDNISGEQVVYTYDTLNRLATAAAASKSWGQSYSYDGFGNLTGQKVTAGSAPSYSVVYNAATNRQTTDCADTNGNVNSSAGGCGTASYNYDVSNRVVSLASSTPSWQYSYAPHNKRVWRGVWTSGTITTDEVTFWGANGRKLGTWALSFSGTQLIATMTATNAYFGKRLIYNNAGFVAADKLGSIGHFYPWGQEKPSATANGTEKFTGYFRDAQTGNDYAVNRYHVPGQGRFLTTDPTRKSIHLANPGSWNRYAYVGGDPVNNRDPTGLLVPVEDCDPVVEDCICDPGGDFCWTGGGGGGGGGGGCGPENSTLSVLEAVAEDCGDPEPGPGAAEAVPTFLLVIGDCYKASLLGPERDRTYEVLNQYYQLVGNGQVVEENLSSATNPNLNGTIVGGGVWTTGSNGQPFSSFTDLYAAGSNGIISELQNYFAVVNGSDDPLTVLEPSNNSGNPATYNSYATQGVYMNSSAVWIEGYSYNPILGYQSCSN